MCIGSVSRAPFLVKDAHAQTDYICTQHEAPGWGIQAMATTRRFESNGGVIYTCEEC